MTFEEIKSWIENKTKVYPNCEFIINIDNKEFRFKDANLFVEIVMRNIMDLITNHKSAIGSEQTLIDGRKIYRMYFHSESFEKCTFNTLPYDTSRI